MNDKGLWAIALVMILAVGGMLYYDFIYPATNESVVEMSKSGGL